MVEKEGWGGSREFKEKATQKVCLCGRGKDQCGPSQRVLRDRGLLLRTPFPRPLGDPVCSQGMSGVRSRSRGPQATPRGRQAAGHFAPRNLLPSQSAVPPVPYVVFSDTTGDPG